MRKDLLGGLEWFDAEGRLVKTANGAGNTLELEYRESGELESIRDERGRSIDFDKPSSEGQRIVLASGVELAMSNDEEGRLSSLELDGEPVREFIYKSMSSSQKYRYLLTEIRSDGEHVSSYEYDGQGRVIESYKLLSNGETVERYQYQYERQGDNVYTTVTQPSGSASTLEFAPINGPQRLVSNTSPCTECGGVSDQSRLYTDQGLLEEAVDFNGVRTEYSYNEDGLEVERREGIASGASSPIRTVLTDWHTELRLPVLELHYEGEVGGLPERLMKWKYNDGGQVTARCEVDPLVSGSDSYNCGSSDTAPSGVRQFLKRYCRESDEDFGTAACPTEGYLRWEELHSRAGGLRTYSYYISDAGDGSYRAGDLWEVVNSLGQVTEVLEYDPAGRPKRIRDPNGVDSVMTYGKRGRLLTMGIDGETTSYDYLANGLIERVTQPDGSYLDFEYDGAQRLKAIENTFGERVEYELDAAGNRVAEYIHDETGTLSFELQQLFDQLGRLESTINGSGYQTEYEYDAAGNLTQIVDALENATIHEYDSLNRLERTVDAIGGETVFSYDARDNLVGIVDPEGLSTNYTYNAFDELVELDSPDTGITTYTYDSDGNRISQTDARGVTVDYDYDQIHRLLSVSYPDSSLDIAYFYDEDDSVTGCEESYPVGRLTRMMDPSATTVYCYDARGSVTKKTQTVGLNSVSVGYDHDAVGRLTSITYPSGREVVYSRDAGGRVTSLQLSPGDSQRVKTIVSAVDYLPFGAVKQYTFGNQEDLVRSHNLDYDVTEVVSPALDLQLQRDAVGNIDQLGMSGGNQSIVEEYVYDDLYRLEAVQDDQGVDIEPYCCIKSGLRAAQTQ